MSQDILVVEYEPRYTERVRQALTGQVLQPVFAKDGEEALRALENTQPRLIVVSSMLPKMSSSELIRQIRIRGEGQQLPPILLTITGYNGKSPKADAARMGAADLLPKPYSSTEFLGKVRQMLGNEAPEMPAAWPTAEIHDELKQLAAEPARPPQAEKKPRVDPLGDIDAMLAQTLSGVRVPGARRTDVQPKAEPAGAAVADLDKLLEDTLSGLEKKLREKELAARDAKDEEPPAESPKPRMEAKWVTPVVPAVDLPSPATQVPEQDATDGVRFGQYVLTEKIAVGGMAEVWKARMRGVEGFQKIVAIKKILPHLSDNAEFVDMFVDEAKLAAQLNHSNITHIYDLGKIGNSYYIAMEYVEGRDLKSILKRATGKGQPLPVELALFIASKIAAALDYAHRRRDFEDNEMEIVHRDVSPQNVLISHEGDIKLCDFGIAKAASKASHTLAGALKGKLQYMSPEQAWGRQVDRRSDIFALGILLFELLAGRKLFIGDNELSILEQVRHARVTAPSSLNEDVTPQIDAVVLKALQKEPEDRYQTAGEMARDLDSIVYNFWPTPTSADLAIYMHHLHEAGPASEASAVEAAEPVAMPEFHPSDAQAEPVASAAAEPPVQALVEAPSAMPAAAEAVEQLESSAARRKRLAQERAPIGGALVEERKKSLPVAAIVAGVLVLGGAAAAAGYFALRGGAESSAGVPAAAASMIPAAGLAAATPPVEGATGSVPAMTAEELAASAAPLTDEARIDEEVRRRLDAERTRLEAQRAQLLSAAQPIPASSPRNGVQPIQAPPAVVEETPPQSQPQIQVQAQPQAQAPPAIPAATPAPAAAAVEDTPEATTASIQYRPGDLVPLGTDGLVSPVIVSQHRPPYPPLAKMQKVQGVVVVQALISETGKVLEVKVLRGVPQDVGINEAAMEAARRSTYRPATINGVAVKSYKNLTIPFRL
jgi:TonB family protein